MSGTTERPRYFGDHFPNIDKSHKESIQLFLSGNVGARTGLASDGVVVGEFTPQNVDGALLFDTDAAAGSQYTDATSALNTGTYTFTITAANDALYIGMDNKFSGLVVDMGTAGVGSTLVWSYWDGAAWTNLATAHKLIDSSTSLTAGTATYIVSWLVPTNWATRSVGDAQATITGKYWIRLNAAGNYTTDPIITALDVMERVGSGFKIPFNGYLERVDWIAGTEANDADITFNLINLTSGESTSVELTQATRVGSDAVAAAKGLYCKYGDELVVQAISTATTNFANMTFSLVFRT